MHAIAAGLLLLGWLGPPPAARDAHSRVALVRIEGDERLYVRLCAELRAQRFEVVEVAAAGSLTSAAAPSAPTRELEDALRVTGADAAIRVESSSEAIRVWIANGVTGKQIFREVAPEEYERLDRAIVALWAVELLRASAFSPRIEAATLAPAPSGPPPQAGAALEVAPAVALSPGGLGPSWHLMLGARWQRGSLGGFEALLLMPMVPLRLERTGGVALISMGLLGAGLYAATGSAHTRWSAQAAVGAALLVMRATGDATTDALQGRTDQAASGGPYLRVGASLRATGWFRLRADALSGAMFPRPVVAFDQATVASWGRPWVAAFVGGEATF
jgi:hypothetical protein